MEDANITYSEQLSLRRQFILGPEFVEHLTSWKRLQVEDDLFLTAHPDLHTDAVIVDDASLTLCGYVLDPALPDADDHDICCRLLHSLTSVEEFVRRLSELGGRYLVILRYKSKRLIIGDAGGLRPLFYMADDRKPFWAASDPSRIAEQLRLQYDPQTTEKFLNSRFVRKNAEFWYPGDSTPYAAVRHLLPNHCLDLDTRQAVRIWPSEELTRLPLEEAVDASATVLQGLVKAACKRFPLAIGITAGIDSRTVLAAERASGIDVIYYTGSHFRLSVKNADISIPANLLPQLGIEHYIMPCPQHVDPRFLEIFKANITTARVARAPGVFWTYKRFGHEYRTIVLGTMSEVGRCFYGSSFERDINEISLAARARMWGNEFAINHFRQWLLDADDAIRRCRLGVLDLFYWEQRIGNWGSMSVAESDIAHEVFVPFNCRRVLANMLAVEEKYRLPPEHLFHKELIRKMWPEALAAPFNPIALTQLWRKIAKKVMRRYGWA